MPIFSFLIKCGDKYLHYNFVVALLNDLFGIQARGGCSCAGPYGHRLLDIDLNTSREYEAVIAKGVEILKPGWVRVGFNYFFNEDDIELLLRAIEWIADNGVKMLPWYTFDESTGVWQHVEIRAHEMLDLTSLTAMQDADGAPDTIDHLIHLADQYAVKKPDCCVKPECYQLDLAPQHLH